MSLVLNEDSEKADYFVSLLVKAKTTLETLETPAPTGLDPWFYTCRDANIMLLQSIIALCEKECPELKA